MRFSSKIMVFIFSIILVSISFLPVGFCQGEIWKGMKAPDFTLMNLQEAPGSLTEYLGDRATVIVFWATWSANSSKELTRLEEIYKTFENSGLSVVGINVESQAISTEDNNKILGWVEARKLSFPLLVDDSLDTFHKYGVVAVPTTIIIDGEGIIRYILSGYPMLKSMEMLEFLDALMLGKSQVEDIISTAYVPKRKAVRYHELGKRMLYNNRLDSAISYLSMAERMDPEFIAVRLMLGKVYDLNGQPDNAEKEYRTTLDIEPDNAVALAQLGHILYDKGHFDEAAGVLKRALEADGSYSPAHYYFGLLLGTVESWESGEKHFKLSEGLNPLDHKLYLSRAKVFQKAEMLEKAAEQVRKALETLAGYNKYESSYMDIALYHFSR